MKDLNIDQPENLDDIEEYAELGHSSILYLLLESMGVRDDNSKIVASHVGCCSGIMTLLRAMPYNVEKVNK